MLCFSCLDVRAFNPEFCGYGVAAEAIQRDDKKSPDTTVDITLL